ncbi:MAG TPA: DUF2283 domain-containing protein [Allocoleopsis sp.]
MFDFPETDTLYIEFNANTIEETRDLDENTLIDLDVQGNVCGITIEQTKKRTDIPNIYFEEVNKMIYAL